MQLLAGIALISAPVFAHHSTSAFETEKVIKVEGTVGTVGITDFAQKALGDVVFVGLPDVGASFKKGCVCLLCTAHGQSSCAVYAHTQL